MKRVAVILAPVLVTVAIARAQPLPDVPIPPDDGSGSDAGSGAPIPPDDPNQPPPPVRTEPIPRDSEDVPRDPYGNAPAPKPQRPLKPISMPEVLTTPTGFMLPAAIIYSKSTIDTGGGVTSDLRIGLGDVAEFGIATVDNVRDRVDENVKADRIQPYFTASFRLGVAEDRLFAAQPAIALGFRKSFERNHDGFTTRTAELTLVASKHLGKNVAAHVGGAFWDASLEGDLDNDVDTDDEEATLHGFDNPVKHQVRVFGGIEVRPLPRSQILIDLGWAPEFCYRCALDADEMTAGDNVHSNKIRLKPVLSWGVRYELAPWMRVESGVRLPDIGEANLLEAQIFGSISFTSRALARTVESFK